MSFVLEATAARDAAFAELGVVVLIDPDGAAPAERLALPSDQTVTEQLGPIPLAQRGRFLRFKAGQHPARGALVALLDGPSGAEVERRRVQGDPVFVGARRLVVEIDTAPA